MRRLSFLVILLGCLVSLCSMTCEGDDYERGRDSDYEPITLDRTNFDNSIRFGVSNPMKQAGKIYVYKQWIFISDLNKGFHVYDNTNPETPVLKSFIEVPGATDMAIRNDIVYINQAVDLVAIQVDPNKSEVKVLKRIQSVFPTKKSPDGFIYGMKTDKKVVVDWVKK